MEDEYKAFSEGMFTVCEFCQKRGCDEGGAKCLSCPVTAVYETFTN